MNSLDDVQTWPGGIVTRIEALSYNALVQSWPEIARLAAETPAPVPETLLWP